IHVEGTPDLMGTLRRVRIERSTVNSLFGSLVEDEDGTSPLTLTLSPQAGRGDAGATVVPAPAAEIDPRHRRLVPSPRLRGAGQGGGSLASGAAGPCQRAHAS